ncbi:Clp protease N-terminal domain-containing protein [Streptomyces kanasensis]|uniref:Clp protease N-terminal domain-containing protein n=1 Tax=Streptomyces kanasensis TaxID=936756 RepID=UPI0036F558FB
MQRSTPPAPRQPAHRRAEPEPPLAAAGLVAAVAGARRRAARDGDREIDTAHLLHSLVESDPDVRAAVGGAPRVARLLGYLAQRGIGYGLRWRRSVEDSAPPPVVAGSPDSTHSPAVLPTAPSGPALGPGTADTAGGAGVTGGALPGWSPVATAALAAATARAVARGASGATPLDLLAALAADPRCRAVEVLTRAGVDPTALCARLDAPSAPPSQQVS